MNSRQHNRKRLEVLLLVCGSMMFAGLSVQAQTMNTPITVVNSSGSAIVTHDGGKSWQIVQRAPVAGEQERMSRRISAQHQGAVEMPLGRTAVYPNPTRGVTSIKYEMDAPGEVRLTLHDSHGSELYRTIEGPRDAGEHILRLDTAPLSDGVYFVQIVSGGRIIAGSTVIVAR